ncbi:winged helix-turn-helix domain-containing protein, partial [Paenibacillus sp. P22]|uniref:winged helix-turn-helix domain-containing protein n=1 Tax=Paenibacillus sp. P22 TaxID=483908 RepID=UPI000432A65C
PEAADMLAAGPFRLSERLHKLWKDGREIVLTPTELSRGQAAASFEPEAADMLAAGPFRLSERLHKLWKDGREIVLTPTEWTLVKLLMERCGQSVSRDEILSEVWGRYYVGDLKVVDVNIRRIRQKIESNPSEPAIIETVWGYGYRWKRGEA